MFIRVGVGADTDTVRLYDHRNPVERILFSFRHGIHRVEHVFTVAMNNLQVLKTGEVIGYLAIGRLVFFRYGYSVSVILNDEYDR